MKPHGSQIPGAGSAEAGTAALGGAGTGANHQQLALLIDLLRRRAPTILGVAAAGTALAVVLGLRAPTLYTAKTLIEIQRHAEEPVPAPPSAAVPASADPAPGI
jgi:uncharacterized protein involved in exopolysaccharide biosynthesis